MQRGAYFLLGTVMLILSLFFGGALASGVPSQPVTIFQMEDPVGDDFGPGTYVYPMGAAFDPKQELLDLTKFTVSQSNDTYDFDLQFKLLNNRWGAPEGYSQPIIQIYLDTKAGQGRTETLREGAFVNFDADHGWEYLINVVGWHNTAVYAYTDDRKSRGNRQGIMVGVRPDQQTIRVVVPRKYLAGDPADWAYYVLVGSQDGLGPDNYRAVMEKATEWQLGGGTDTNYDPNVIDLLAPATGLHSQRSQLAQYSVEQGRLAEVYPVSLSKAEKAAVAQKGGSWEKLKAILRSVVSPLNNKYPLKIYYPLYAVVVIALLIVSLLVWVNFGSRFKKG